MIGGAMSILYTRAAVAFRYSFSRNQGCFIVSKLEMEPSVIDLGRR
jgi:hypothetical protein